MNQRSPWPWFTFEVRSTVPPSPERSLESSLAAVIEDRPYWMADATQRVSLSTLKSSRAKARSAPVANPTRERLRAAIFRDRATALIGGGATYSLSGESVGEIGSHWGSLYRAYFNCARPAGDLWDGRCADALFRVARVLVAGCGDVQWGAGWFGAQGLRIAAGLGFQPGPGLTYGYSFMMCLPPPIVEVLGGASAVRQVPAAEVREVVTMSGQRCVLVMLARSPDDVSYGLLRNWRDFLLPVIPPDAVDRRRAGLERVASRPSPVFDLPAMVLPEDWP